MEVRPSFTNLRYAIGCEVFRGEIDRRIGNLGCAISPEIMSGRYILVICQMISMGFDVASSVSAA
jgi:hypothetical protein